MKRAMTEQRRRFKRKVTFKDRLQMWAEKVRANAELLQPGPEKDALPKKASQADTASHLDEWANSKGLLPPK